ncbi:MAG: GEVED domain-containing protein [Rubripirellula sp.]
MSASENGSIPTAHTSKKSTDRLRQKRRRKDRRLLTETLEARQLLAGPDLIGIQPNEGALLNDGTELNVSPRELVFRFDDNADIDPSTLSAIRITRAGEDGVFESATATSDLGTSGQVLLEFRAVQSGSLGNGVQVVFTSSSRTGSSLPIITVADQVVTVNVNSNPGQPTRVQDLISSLNANSAASQLVEAIQVSGPSQGDIGTKVPTGLTLSLVGANSAEAVTDFGTNGDIRVRVVSQLPGVDGRGTIVEIERRDFGGQANPVVVVTGSTIRVQLNSNAAFPSTAADFINAINTNPDASALILAVLQEGDVNTAIGAGTTTIPSLTLSGVTDVVVEPGFVGLGDSSRDVVFRFAEPLPDDLYQIDILGGGAFALRNVDGELFQDGVDLSRRFQINLGPKVVAVVPEPIRRDPITGALSPDIGKIEVHFNDDDLDKNLAETAGFYQLVFTRDTATNQDDVIVPLTNTPVYNNITNIVTLNYGRPLSRLPDPANAGQFLTGAVRLRVGTSEGLAAAPTVIPLVPGADQAGDTFNSAYNLDSQWTISPTTTSATRLSGEIFNTDSYDLTLPGPNLPGTREIRPDDPSRLARTVPLDYLRNGADSVNGISVIQYDFAPSWQGDDPTTPGFDEDKTYFNIISEQQKQRVREVMSLYSEYLGISFIEVEGGLTSQAAISIAVGDLYGTVTDVNNAGTVSSQGDIAVDTRDRNGDGIDDLGVMDFQDFDESIDDQFGGEFFRGSMFIVGQLLGYGYADDLPQPVTQSTSFIFTPGTDNEPAFPSVADIVNGQYLYRPDSTDIDLYKFTVASRGTISIESIAERLADPSLLDTTLRLYKLGSEGTYVEIAQNDDYFSNDSAIDIENLSAGSYMIGVSARGNNNYDPSIEGSGFGGLSEGNYELSIKFQPAATSGIRDAGNGTTSQALDGDGDNKAGGVFDFWFVPSDSNNTLYVDKAASATAGSAGTVGNPYREIDQAIAAAQPGDTIRVVGNGGTDGLVQTTLDNFSYQVGFGSNGLPLADGSSLNVPKDVHLVIEAGAIIKLSGARLGVGSVSPLIDVSNSSLQVLGTPSIIGANGLPARDATNQLIPGSVYFTSLNDRTIGMGNATVTSRAAQPGDWGGIDFRGDLDSADESRRNREDEAVFLNHIQYADMRYGGGAVSVGGQLVAISPIDMAVTRPTIINSRISDSADAAIAATPDTFTETRFTEPSFQAGGAFTPDFTRVGPDIHGNVVIDNSINGLFVRVVTRTGDVVEKVTTTARFDDTDIPHVLTENLVIQGTPGGPILQSSAPSALLVRSQPAVSGNVPAGTYTYRITNVNAEGLESAASQNTAPVTLTSQGSVRLTQLPTTSAGTSFVSRRLYRATIDPTTGLPGEFRLVSQLNASNTFFTDSAAAGSTLLSTATQVLRSRLDASLVIDPGTVLKVDGARIEARFGGNLTAEGTPSLPIVFTSLEDQRYGGGGTFDTNDRGDSGELNPGDWGGIYIGAASAANIDQAVIAGAGGSTRIEGGFASFNAIEVQQGRLRLANTRLEQNADGRGDLNGERVGRGDNGSATVFVRAATPVIVDNLFIDNEASALSFDVNSLSGMEVNDPGRATGLVDKSDVIGNSGPLVQGNVLSNNAINGMQIRGGELATAGVWDDIDIVHVVTESIEIPNQYIFGGLRLQSDTRGSLVVKFQSDAGENAGIVVGGSLATASEEFVDIADRIGGSLQVVGHPDFPVILTTLADDTAGAGFTLAGLAQMDTNNDGITGDDLANQSGDGFARFPFGAEVDRNITIDNDVDVNTVGYFEATPQAGHTTTAAGVTVTDQVTGQVVSNQDYFFDFATYVIVGTTVTRLSATTITQQPTLIADDVVESRGTFTGANGEITWIAQTEFRDGIAVMFSSLELEAADDTALGDVRVVNFLHPDVGFPGFENVYAIGTPGESDFRAVTYQINQRFGFGHGGYFEDDGINQVNANYVGWGADIFANLETQIQANTQGFTPDGTINLANLPAITDARLGQVFGTGDVNTAFAWDVNPTGTSSTITSFVELLPDESSISNGSSVVESGLWNGIVIREAASDRNVAAIPEQEPVRSAFIDSNAIPSQSQFLGEIAPNEQSGDENRRLGFVVEGAISQRNDLDVYSFIGQSGTEVWLDIDQTGSQLDSVVELIDANGRVLASSNDSLLAETNDAALFTAAGVNPDAARPLSVVTERLAVQQITISGDIQNATGGNLELSIPSDTSVVELSTTQFLQDPAGSIRGALENAYGVELGAIAATLLRRSGSQDYVIQLRFDSNFFIGRTVPQVTVTGSTITGATVTATNTNVLLDSQLQDAYSTNAKDAGMRIVLPGEAGTRNLYHVRVRSSNTTNPLDFNTLNDVSQIHSGLSAGAYQLQVRLQETDEHAGTQMRLADVRYAVNGLQIIGQPLHSPLLGEDYEIDGDNDSLANAQALGYYSNSNGGASGPLQSDQLAKSFAGSLSSATDVDWYRFDINYEDLTRGPNDPPLYFSTVFDLDYADGFARADMALYVFNEAGQLIYVGGDSNIADDLPGLPTSNNTDDLSRGSAGQQDPYIGAAEMAEGIYYVAVSNQSSVPLPLDQFFNPLSANPLLRLEPIDSVQRIAEDRIDSFGGGTATDPVTPILFDDSSIVPYSLDDVVLYVNTGNDLRVVNPFTGQSYGSVGNFGSALTEIAFRSNGELFAYSGTTNNDFFYHRIDTGTAAISAPLSTDAAIDLYRATAIVDATTGAITFTAGVVDEALVIQAISIAATNGFNTPTLERGFLVGERQNIDLISTNAGARYSDNILYSFDPDDGRTDGTRFIFTNRLTGAGSNPFEIGQINTDRFDDPNFPTGTTVQEFYNVLGFKLPDQTGVNPGLADGDTFTIQNFETPTAQSVTFEFNSGPTIVAGDFDPATELVDGQFINIDGRIFEINTGERISLAPAVAAGSTIRVEGQNGEAATFQFITTGRTTGDNIGIQLRDAASQFKTADVLASELATQINLAVGRVGATAVGSEIVFGGIVQPSFSTTGSGLSILGNTGLNNSAATAVNVLATATPNVLISRLAEVIRLSGIEVSASNDQLSLPGSTSVTVSPVALGQTLPPLQVLGETGVTTGNLEIPFRQGESAEVIAARIRSVINSASAVLTNVEAVEPSGTSQTVQITGGQFLGPNGDPASTANNVTASGSLVRSGVRLGGTVTGVEVVSGNNMYAVTNLGELYVISNSELRAIGNRGIGQLVDTATDLIGLNFTALRSGPISYNDGELRETLFGITGNGDIYAFNTAGELQPVFANGQSMISTGIGGALGLDFSTLGYNLWHTTTTRSADPGHGIDALDNGTRGSTGGGSSLAFNLQGNFNGNYPNAVELPNATARQDGTAVDDTYNLPGGAKGVIQSQSFSLDGYSPDDEPTLYFNYFLNTDGVDSATGDRDALRVYVVAADGSQHLVASNNTARLIGDENDEFDDPAPTGQYNDTIDVETQQLFDNTGSWRQARVPLNSFAGQKEISLRIEFSTGGQTGTGTVALRTKSGEDLFHNQSFVISGETFSIDLSTAVGVPSGTQLALLYNDPAARSTLTIEGQVYVLNDGSRVINAGEISVPLFANSLPGATLAGLSAAQIAEVLGQTVQLSPPPPAAPISGLRFTDPDDFVPASTAADNDTIVNAFALPYVGGSATFVGTGQLGYDGNVGAYANLASLTDATPLNLADVDLMQLDVAAGTTIDVSIGNAGDFNMQTRVRFFESDGTPLLTGVVPNTGTFVSDIDRTVFIGISGLTNQDYDPATGDNQVNGSSPGTYEATIAVSVPNNVRIQSSGNLVEFGGLDNVVVEPANLFTVTGDTQVLGIPVVLSRFMSAAEVAAVVQQVVADRFAGGAIDSLPTNGASILLPLLSIDDSGPFATDSERSGDAYGAGPVGGSRDNAFEGVYLDDFIIGFAERGEVATNSNPVTAAFVTDTSPQFPLPNDPVSNLVTGAYQVEIRSGSEYVVSSTSSQFRTFDTNERLTDSRTITALPADQIRDGSSFSLNDGRSTIEFEFDLIEASNGVTPGRVQIPYTMLAVEPGSEQINSITGVPIAGSGTLRPQTAAEIANLIVDAINRSDVQSLIDVTALVATGTNNSLTTVTNSAVINLFGDVIIDDAGGALGAVDLGVLRGDNNRDRDGQGIILIENSRFLYNEENGIAISHGLTANVAGQDTPSIVRYPRNLVELNTENLAPGVIIQSNVIAFNGTSGLQIDGVGLGVNDTAGDPVAFDRIVNNTIIGGSIVAGRQSPPQTFSGTLFPQGAISFADSVVSYLPNAGGSQPTSVFQDSTQALGIPNGNGRGPEPIDGTTTVSLGLGGSLTLQFDDNLLTGSGDSQPDLIVYETGAIESVSVEISRDGVKFENVGTLGGLTNLVDIDAFGFGTQDRFAFVRLTDLRQGGTSGASLGADIDAVGAISSVPVESYSAGGTGIELVGNAAPVLLNNVIANTVDGVILDPTNTLPILGGNTFYRNTTNVPTGVSVGQFAQELSDAEVIFVGAADLVFAPAAGAGIIDSSIDSLEDRPSITTVKNPLGLPPSPILAPRLDVNGQLRIDDPNVETPSGLGERVFKDRGASDRGDLVGPRVVLLAPLAPNLGLSAGAVSVPAGSVPRFFEIQLIDGIAPADVTPGTGIDDRSVSNQSVLLLKDNVALIEGIDYRFGYNPSTNVIRLTPIAGVWEPNSTYVIRMIDSSDAIVAASAGASYIDGGVLSIRDLNGTTTNFEYETGITLTVPDGTIEADRGEGIQIAVFDGVNTITFELDNDQLFDSLNVQVPIPLAGGDALIAQAIANAVNASSLNLTANVSGTKVQFLGTNPLTTVVEESGSIQITGQIGTAVGFGLQIPADGAAVADTIEDGQTFVVRRGSATAVTFELDNNGSLETPNAIAVSYPVGASLDQIADAIVRSVGGAGLGLSPSNAGSGQVFLGGDANYSLDLTGSVFTQLGLPGQVATLPIIIPIDQSASELSVVIADAINAANLFGVSTSIVDSRVFVEGTSSTSGVGVVDTLTIRDEVGNLLQSNQANGRTELIIFVGGGFDYGDAPTPYSSLLVEGGPRHGIDTTLTLGQTVSADSDAKLSNADDDDGVTIGTVRGGFTTNVSVSINNSNASRSQFFLDAWFDWNDNGVFELSEVQRFGSVGTGRSVVGNGVNNLLINVPASAAVGEIYARFRLSEQDNLGSTGDAATGEVEDYSITVSNNPFQNPAGRFDVNASGIVTPLDALQIINAIDRNGKQNIRLDSLPLPTNLPQYPDVNGDGSVTALDALQVINQLARLPDTTGGSGELVGEGELTGFVQVASGVMASGATRLGDDAIAEAEANAAVSTIEAPVTKTSVFDNAAVVDLDSIVDSLAEDSVASRDEAGEMSALDQLFAGF